MYHQFTVFSMHFKDRLHKSLSIGDLKKKSHCFRTAIQGAQVLQWLRTPIPQAPGVWL